MLLNLKLLSVARIQPVIVLIDGLVGYKLLFGIAQLDGHSVAPSKKILASLVLSIHSYSKKEHALKVKRHVIVVKFHTFTAKWKMEASAADLELLG